MHLVSSVQAKTNRNETTTRRRAIQIPRLEVVTRWAFPLGLFVVLCLRHAVAGAV